MNGAGDVQFRRWQEEVARDPGCPAFLPLAEVYRREGRLEVARRLCLRGLERHPEHVEAHTLLGRIYRELGDQEKAFDEWDIALQLDPEHQGARRALGYLCLEQRNWAGAVRHLDAALSQEPDDARLASALALARRHVADADASADPREDAAAVLSGPLDRFVRGSRARLALLIETNGRVLAQHGFSHELDVAAFATLGAGIHGASSALARMLGQPRFQQLFQGEGERQLFLGTVDGTAGELILIVVFGSASNLGLVRVLYEGLLREVAELPLSRTPLAAHDAVAYEAELAAGLQTAAYAETPKLLRS